MDIENRKIWQQAAGDTDRNYVKICKDFDVILNGPGGYGKWPECLAKLKEDKWGRKISDLRRFSEEMKPGDLVVLKLGTREAHAVGEVHDLYEHHTEFGDVDGWDLEHVRRVRWLWQASEKPKKFDPGTLHFGDTTQRLNRKKVALMSWLRRLEISDSARSRPLKALPIRTAQELKLEQMADFLTSLGITQPDGAVLERLRSIVKLASWYSEANENPSEYETVSNLVHPLLRLLGWSHQQLAIEWQNIDVALFSNLPRKNENVSVILEAKRRGRSCLHAFPQAARYARTRPNCQRLILTDGIRYWVYVKRGERFDVYAHLNLKRPRAEYPIYRCAGAQEALLAMRPEWSSPG